MVEQGTHKPLAGGSNPPSATTSSRDALAAAVVGGTDVLSVSPDAALLLAVSGGPDSMALLHGAVAAVSAGTRRWSMTVAHLDHGLRRESRDDARFVADAAASLGLPFHGHRTDVRQLASQERRSLEDAGRVARYRFFEDVAAPGALIATAHTLDDRVETVILNLLRGSGLAGIAGIPERRGRIVRPLIAERRANLRAALDEVGLPYRVDPTNDDPAHLRNRVRSEVLPLLEKLRPGAAHRIGRFASLAADEDHLLDLMAKAELTRRRQADGAIDWRDPPPVALGRRVVRIAVGAFVPSAERVEALLTAASAGHGGTRIELGDGRIATITRRSILLGVVGEE